MASTSHITVDRSYWHEKLESQQLAARFAGHLKSNSSVSAKIFILPPEPRAAHEAKRGDDRRLAVWR